jgi:hypothetical protein
MIVNSSSFLIELKSKNYPIKTKTDGFISFLLKTSKTSSKFLRHPLLEIRKSLKIITLRSLV